MLSQNWNVKNRDGKTLYTVNTYTESEALASVFDTVMRDVMRKRRRIDDAIKDLLPYEGLTAEPEAND